MKDYIAKRSKQSVPKIDILAINQIAKQDEANGNKVINASVGMFLNNNKNLGYISSINKSLNENICKKMEYPPITGIKEFNDSILKSLFNTKYDELFNKYNPFIGATLGGTGAISTAFNLFLEENETVLLPDIMWGNYKLIAKKSNINFETYSLFNDEEKFNINSLKEKIKELKLKNKNILILINDPCQNPTGYSLTSEEYDELFSLLNKEGIDSNITCLFDIAYISFSDDCPLINKLFEYDVNFLPILAFSCSKTFSMYGLRVGALICLPKDKDNHDEIKRAFQANARGTYSVPNGSVQYSISLLFNDKNNIKLLEEEIKINKLTLLERSNLIIKELNENNIKYYPYKNGFFISLKIDNAYEITEKLKEKHIYVVPIKENVIRLAISGMNNEEISLLVKEITKLINN